MKPTQRSSDGGSLPGRREEAQPRRLEGPVDPYWLIVTGAPVGLFELAADGTTLRANPAFLALVGRLGQSGQTLELHLSDLVGQETCEAFLAAIEASGRALAFDVTIHRLDGETFPAKIDACGIEVSDGGLRIVGALRDASEDRAKQESLLRKASHDSLTALPHRGALFDDLQRQLARIRRSPEHRFAVAFLDLDDFKRINDTAGHVAGDQVLSAVASRLKRGLRPDDRAFRYGGDEFVLILAGVQDFQDAKAVGARLLELVAGPFRIGEDVFELSASLGICLCDDGNVEAQDLIRAADAAMYGAKRGGITGNLQVVAI